MVNQIAIIGAGQLGSRHLQGLTKSTKKLVISIVDPNKDSLNNSEKKYLDVENPSQINKISYHKNMNDLPDCIDVVIIATTASVRRIVVENLLSQTTVKYLILEKIVFQKSDDFIPIQNLLDKTGTKTWINCIRRSYPIYKELKKIINGRILKINVSGNNWGMASNSIHMIDLLVFLTGQMNLNFDTRELSNAVYPSRRDGYKELRGKFIVRTNRGDILEIMDHNSFEDGELKIVINTEKKEIIVDEIKGLLIQNQSKGPHIKRNIKIPYQSEITGQLVDQILDTGQSDLTPYEECMTYHIPMIDAFNNHISNVIQKKVTTCPIT